MNAELLESVKEPSQQAGIAPPGDNIALGRLIDAAYVDYHQRLARGERVDAREFCEQFPPVRSSLAKLLEADEWVGGNPEYLLDAPANWPQVGTTWEGFELLTELGRGAFARVYLACELALGGRLVAIKCTSFGAREAATLGRLDHPGVVPIHSIRDLPDQNLTIVCMPYLGHATLLDVCRLVHGQKQPTHAHVLLEPCRDKLLPAPKAAAGLLRGSYLDGVRCMAARIAGALAYLHTQGICHRDLKPSNILLQPDGSPRLLDFNLSSDTLLPRARVGGTLHYMAPEQLEAMDHGDVAVLTPQVDVFAFGVILYEWLVGSHPCTPLPNQQDPDALSRYLVRRYRELPMKVPVDIDRSLAGIIEQCLRLDPAERPTAAEVERTLLRQLRPERRLGRRLARHPFWSISAAAMFITTIVFAALLVANRPPRSQIALEEGQAAYRSGDFHVALDKFRLACDEGADAAVCFEARAKSYHRLGASDKKFFDLAIAEYQEAQKRSPDAAIDAYLGYCAHRIGSLSLAAAYYGKALERKFAPAVIHHNLACLYRDQSNFKPAQYHFEQALAGKDCASLTRCQFAEFLTALHLYEIQGKPEAPGGSAPLPDLLKRALKHLNDGLPDIKQAHPQQAAWIARIFALTAPFDRGQAANALTWLERAIDAGSPVTVCQDPAFGPLALQPRFAALPKRQPLSPRPVADWVRLLDPLDE